MIVDLAVEDECELTVLRDHRLVSSFGHVENSEPPEAERNASHFVDPRTRVVRAATANGFGHDVNCGAELRTVLLSCRINNSREPAHF